MIIAALSLMLFHSRKRVVRHSMKIMEETIEERTNELMLSEKKYQAVFHGVNDGLVVLKDGRVSYFNQGAVDLLGYTPEELIGKNPLDFIFVADEEGSDLSVYKQYAKDAIDGKSVLFETILMRKDGSLLYAEVALADLEEKSSLIMTLRDITLRKKAEKEKRDEEEYTRMMEERAKQKGVKI